MWPNPHFPADLVTFTGEILNGKLLLRAVIPAFGDSIYMKLSLLRNWVYMRISCAGKFDILIDAFVRLSSDCS